MGAKTCPLPQNQNMAHEFTSGIMLNGEKAWHGLGTVMDGTLPAREAFIRANALYNVQKVPLYTGNPEDPSTLQQVQQRVGVQRADNGEILGTVSPNYELIQNETLCRFAEALRDDCVMDTVVVLKKGAKVAFTARILGSETNVLPGDTVHRNIVGYLGHDGFTSFGGIFTNVRVVCQNTLGFAQQDGKRSGKQFTIKHNKNDVAQIDNVLRNIDVARQSFAQVVENYQRMSEVEMDFDLYRKWLAQVYEMPAVKQEDGTLREGEITDSPVKWNKLWKAWAGGYGSQIEGVQGTLWGAFNAVTEVESSLRTNPSKNSSRLQSAVWGSGSRIIERAETLANQLVLTR